MRYSLSAALVAALLSFPAMAQEDEDTAEGEGAAEAEGAPTGSMDSGRDPAETETSDNGPFAPKGKTGEVEEKAEEKEEDEKVEAIPRKQINAFLDALLFFGAPPDPGRTVSGGDSIGYGIVLGGLYDLSPEMSAGLRFPWSYVDLDAERLQAGSMFEGSSMAIGNPELMGEYRIKMSPRTTVPIRVGIGIPIAQGNPDPTSSNRPAQAQAMVNRTADAGSGWRDGELYAVGRLPITVGAGLLYQRSKWHAFANTKFSVAPKIRGELENPPVNVADREVYQLNSVALRNVTGFGLQGTIYDELFLGGELWFAWNLIDEFDIDSANTPPSAFATVVEPYAGYGFGMVKARLGYIAPLSGPNSDMGGLRLKIELGI